MSPAIFPSGENQTRSFIACTDLLRWPGYTGLCIQVRFCSEQYHNDVYSQLQIPFPEYLALAGKRRRAEYLAGRYAADILLRELGYIDFILHKGRDRAPCWPSGICGSLSHSGDTVLCALHTCDVVTGLGIDVEYLMNAERAALIQSTVCHTKEFNMLAFLQREQRVTLLFSAKESLFKAIYPQWGHYFSFHDVEMVEVEKSSSRFVLRLCCHLSTTYFLGRCFFGYYRFEAGKFITFIYDSLPV